MRRHAYLRRVSIVCLTLALAGCATKAEPTPVAIDTWCLAARKISWSVNDTPETIKAVETHNRAIDLRCGVKS